jgi:hypothetical protein
VKGQTGGIDIAISSRCEVVDLELARDFGHPVALARIEQVAQYLALGAKVLRRRVHALVAATAAQPAYRHHDAIPTRAARKIATACSAVVTCPEIPPFLLMSS